MKHIIITIICIMSLSAIAQDGFYDPKTGKVTVRQIQQAELDARKAQAEADAQAEAERATLPQLITQGIEVPFVVIQDSGNTNLHYQYWSDGGSLEGGVRDHASPRDPVAIEQRKESNSVARAVLRQDARTVKTNTSAIVKSTRETRQGSRGIVDAVKSANVNTNANHAKLLENYIKLVDAVDAMARDNRAMQADNVALSRQVRNLADIVRRSALRDEPKQDEETGE